MTAASGQVAASGRAGPCAATGIVLLAIPGVIAAATRDSGQGLAGPASVPVAVAVVLAGLVAVVATVAEPEQPLYPTAALSCAFAALLVLPAAVLPAAGSGLAALAFLLATRAHATARQHPDRVGSWPTGRDPLLIGAALTTSAAGAAAALPATWSFAVAAPVAGALAAGITLVFAPLGQDPQD